MHRKADREISLPFRPFKLFECGVFGDLIFFIAETTQTDFSGMLKNSGFSGIGL
jgi:hypothetical protein